ncbi:4'-phosphopantetheinyl transferase superfamily protein [Sphingosinicella sp. BN140058]|uniref:4'-phosphopantetheinyl transferase family protein n=1 Tax=Sphingosinicella sp. BN140058 TaxID=1892855 RepID=UPI0010103E65|nr:4'-phosphopantetheinyl transferase superfamily protein [Sphingosinicella sp. BN140058]QAY79197.1 4'-phosphopantetheinyl transferase superfamily protein [Sphingosinicella sp. BN140058]
MTIDVAVFELAQEPIAALVELLDRDERSRAQAFRFDRDRDRFVARRGALRRHLGGRLGVNPATLRFACNDYGKPFLVDYPELHFSLSHSAGLAICATSTASIGCDIEHCDPKLADSAVAERLFAPAEIAALSSLQGEQWVGGFFACWTRKEAFVKALGLGLSHPLDAFAVSLDPTEPPHLISGGDGWALFAFTPAPGYQAAVAYPEGTGPVVVADTELDRRAPSRQ